MRPRMSRRPNASPPAPGGEAPSDITEFFSRDFPGPFDGNRGAWPLQVPQACPATPVILLSWFDGIGTAAYALHTLGARVVHHVAWEVDRECRAFLGHHWPQAQLRGSFYDDAFELVVKHASVGLAKAAATGGSEPAFVLATAGPPCPDFSRIRGAGATGRKGTEGRKFADFIDQRQEPLRAHCEKSRLAFSFLVENVVMNSDDREHFDNTLRCHSFVCEASDLGPVRRPRLWWTNAKQELREVPGTKWGAWGPLAEAAARSHALVEGSQIRIPRFFAQGKVLLPVEAVKGSWRFHSAVMQGKATLPTLITPAPTGEGRLAPPGARPKGAAEDRWRADGRRFAPSHYVDRAIMYSSDFGLGSDAWAIPPPAVREVLHHFPTGYTAAAGADRRTRETMVGNSWRCGVARYLLALLVVAASMRTAATSATGATSSTPACMRPRSLAPWASCLDRVRDLTKAFPPTFSPPVEVPRMGKVRFVGVEDDPVTHLAAASALAHPFMHPAELEPSLAFAVWFYAELGAEVGRWRADVLREVSLLLEDMTEEIAAWYRSLRPHVQGAYVYRPGIPWASWQSQRCAAWPTSSPTRGPTSCVASCRSASTSWAPSPRARAGAASMAPAPRPRCSRQIS